MGHDVLVLAPRHSPPAAAVAAAEIPSATSAEPKAPSPDHALLRALARAAGRRDPADVAALVPDPVALRGNPAAKRALWPRLRALRRRAAPA
ncbi:hypothetical protein ACFQZQ_07260 [Lysobacter koreensis]|uniref:Alanine acetyltransferase n=1 Tax=Lysobacter koreensis TaxID=266122 RepID=A0ABW2YMI1_9GAMM